MILIFVLNLAVYIATRLLIKSGKIVKHINLLKSVVVIQEVFLLLMPIAHLLLFVDLFTTQLIVDTRAWGLWIAFVYIILGIIGVLFDIVILLMNRFSQKKFHSEDVDRFTS